MFGLIRQLAKLITLVKNLPKVLTLLPKLLGGPEQIATTLAIGMVGNEIESIKDNIDNSINQNITSIQDDARNRVEEIRNSTAPQEIKDREIELINVETNEQVEMVRDSAAALISGSIGTKIKDTARSIEPAIQSAIAPFALIVGIPSGVQYIVDKLSAAATASAALDNVGLDLEQTGVAITETVAVGRDEAEAAFNRDIDALESETASGGSYPIGRIDVEEDVLLVFSKTEKTEFKYDDSGNLISELNLFVKDDVTDSPEYSLTLDGFGITFPLQYRSRITHNIDGSGKIRIRWNPDPAFPDTGSPQFDSVVRFKVSGWKINRRRFLPDTRTRADNSFVIPIKFKETFPQE